MTLCEDDGRFRKGHCDVNLSMIRCFALSMMKNEKSEKLAIQNKRLLAVWNTASLAIAPIRSKLLCPTVCLLF